MHLIACHQCDLVQKIPALPVRSAARCPRCEALLCRAKPNSIDRTIAWTIAGMVLFMVAVSFPFLGIKTSGFEQQTGLLTGIQEVYRQGMSGIALLVLLTCVLVPLLQMLGLLYVLVPLKFDRRAHFAFPVFRLFQHIQPWSMMEVFMLGILVSLVKLGSLATIVPGLAVYSFGLLIFCLAFAVSAVDPHQVWKRLEELS